MPSWLSWLNLVPVLIACSAATLAFVLGATPKQKGTITTYQGRMANLKLSFRLFRQKPFPMIVPSLATLISAVGLVLLSILNSSTGHQNQLDPSHRFLVTPTDHPSPSSAYAGNKIVFVPRTATPTPTFTPTNTPSPTPVTPTSTPTNIPTDTPDVTPTETKEPTATLAPDIPVANNVVPPAPALPTPNPLIPGHCIENKDALARGFGFVEPNSHAQFQRFKIKIGQADYFTIRFAREDELPASTNINDWHVPWSCDEANGTRCQRDRPNANEINGQLDTILSTSWTAEDTSYVFLLQIEIKNETETRELCAYVYDVH